MALRQADRLVSNNPGAYGIARAIEVSGHRSVTTLEKLYAIPSCILSDSGDNTDNDAIGQEWYVIAEGRRFSLVDWEKRNTQEGWRVVDTSSSTLEKLKAGDRISIETDSMGSVTISASSEINDEGIDDTNKTWSIKKLREVINGKGTVLTSENDQLRLDVSVDETSIIINSTGSLSVLGVDGGIYGQ